VGGWVGERERGAGGKESVYERVKQTHLGGDALARTKRNELECLHEFLHHVAEFLRRASLVRVCMPAESDPYATARETGPREGGKDEVRQCQGWEGGSHQVASARGYSSRPAHMCLQLCVSVRATCVREERRTLVKAGKGIQKHVGEGDENAKGVIVLLRRACTTP